MAEEDEEEIRARRAERKKAKKEAEKKAKMVDAPDEGMDPEMAALMGFGGFGTTSQKKS